MINWAITFFLLALVSAIFVFGGTSPAGSGPWGRVATVGLLLCALVMLFIRPRHHDLR